jgi:hypothetical protein
MTNDQVRIAAWKRQLGAFWLTLPLFLWLFAVGPILLLYILVLYVPLTLFSFLLVAILPRRQRMRAVDWVAVNWLPHLRSLTNWYVTKFWNGVRRLWLDEFDVNLPS